MRDPSASPTSGQRRSYKPKVKSGGGAAGVGGGRSTGRTRRRITPREGRAPAVITLGTQGRARA